MLQKISKNALLVDKFINITSLLWLILFFSTSKGLFTIINAQEDLFILGESLFNQVLNVTGSYTWIGGEQGLDVTMFWEHYDIKLATIISQLITIVNLCILLIPFYFLKKVLSSMIAGNPFEYGVSRNITYLGYSIVIIQVLFSFSTGFAQSLCSLIIDNYNRGISFEIDPTVLFTIFIFSTMTAIFKYGEELQRQYDETL